MNYRETFDDSFLWGAATSAYQIEGAVEQGGRGATIWDTFSHTPGMTYQGETGDVAADHYHRIAEDVDLMSRLGINGYRFSIAWSRLLPAGRGDVNPEGVAFYRDLVERLLAAGITPMATLYHWDLPQALQDEGGWLSEQSPDWFAHYAEVAKQHLGDLVSMWTTLNEPWCTAFLGHSSGEHAPGISDPGSAHLVAHHLMLAHHKAIARMRTTNPNPEDRLGIVLNLIPAWPAGNADEDQRVATVVDAIQNRLFLEAVFRGTYPAVIKRMHRKFQISDRIDDTELAGLRQDIDFLGVNYYNVNRFHHEKEAPSPTWWPGAEGAVLTTPPGELTEMGWGVDPEGLSWMLKRVTREYPNVPLYVCENGAAYPDTVGSDGSVDDQRRIEYLEAHVAELAAAINDGVDLRGYFVWSLLDNFEWAKGYPMTFGLIHVDRQTQERTIKNSGYWYRDFIRSIGV